MAKLLLVLIGLASAVTLEECILRFQKQQFEPICLKLAISKLLGYCMIAGSCLLKFPQIIKMVNAKSAKGLSIASFYTEVVGFTLVSAYSMHQQQPFSTYGENIIILVQCWLQVSCLWLYEKTPITSILGALVIYVTVFIAPFAGGLLPENMWVLVPLSNIPLNLVVKFSQIWENFKNSSTGQLSFITAFLNFLGTSARIFTTFVELNDMVILVNYATVCLLNGVIVGQLLWYWNSPIDKRRD